MTNSIYGISNPYSNAYATNYLQNAYGNNYSTNSLAFAGQPAMDTWQYSGAEKNESSTLGTIAKVGGIAAIVGAIVLGIASKKAGKSFFNFKAGWNKLFSTTSANAAEKGINAGKTKEIIEKYLPKAEAERLANLKQLRNNALTPELKTHLEKCGVSLNDDFYKALKEAKTQDEITEIVNKFIAKAKEANPSATFEALNPKTLETWANATVECNKGFNPYRAIAQNSQKHANAISQRNADLAKINNGELKKAIDALGKEKADEIYKLADEGNIANLQTKLQEYIPDYQSKGSVDLTAWVNSSKQAFETTTTKLDSGKIAELAQAKNKADKIYETYISQLKSKDQTNIKNAIAEGKKPFSRMGGFDNELGTIKNVLGIK